jgi:hypothetical protein
MSNEENKRVRVEPEDELVETRMAETYEGPAEVLSVCASARKSQTKQAFWASLDQAQKDRIQAAAFRFLVKKAQEWENEAISLFMNTVTDVTENDDEWLKDSSESE